MRLVECKRHDSKMVYAWDCAKVQRVCDVHLHIVYTSGEWKRDSMPYISVFLSAL